MKLKSFTKKGFPVVFDIADCPIYVSENELALAARKKSSILQANVIVRGDDDANVFEGDTVHEDGELLGYVVYSKGFKMWNINDGVKDLPQDAHIQMKAGTVESCQTILRVKSRTPILLAYMGKIQQFNSLVCAGKNGIRFNNSSVVAKPEDVQFYTGLSKTSGGELFFGEKYDGGTVELYNCEPMLTVGDSHVVIETK